MIRNDVIMTSYDVLGSNANLHKIRSRQSRDLKLGEVMGNIKFYKI